MEKLVAYKMSVAEAEEKLQDWLDDSGLYLFTMDDIWFGAKSDTQELDGTELDERFAEILNVCKCENHISYDGNILVVVTEEYSTLPDSLSFLKKEVQSKLLEIEAGKTEQYHVLAVEARQIYNNFRCAGFTDEQAMELTSKIVSFIIDRVNG